jgi:lipopolysaccharide/colanic/teichoic acid biosynthesis glycosyltransferase
MVRVTWLLSCRLYAVLKRSIDVIAASCALIVFAPLFAITALLIKAHDGGPVLFWQTRVGKWGETFRFPKFRSMVTNAEALKHKLAQQNQHTHGVTFKLQRDPRVTPIGRFLRRFSIDEMPQLWCVLVGHMSLVDPRPALVDEVNQYTIDERQRLDVKPGLTCIWQVSGRADIAFPEQVALDVAYIERRTLREDIKLILKTIPAVFSGRGAY